MVCGCLFRVLADYVFQGTELIYCDPPICMATASRHGTTDTSTGKPTMPAQRYSPMVAIEITLTGYTTAMLDDAN